MPAGRVHERQQQLPTRGRGEAVLEYAFRRDEPVRGSIPTRAPSDHNPLNRKEHLLQVVRRLEAGREARPDPAMMVPLERPMRHLKRLRAQDPLGHR